MEEVVDYNNYHITFKFIRESNVDSIVRKGLPSWSKTGKCSNHIHVNYVHYV